MRVISFLFEFAFVIGVSGAALQAVGQHGGASDVPRIPIAERTSNPSSRPVPPTAPQPTPDTDDDFDFSPPPPPSPAEASYITALYNVTTLKKKEAEASETVDKFNHELADRSAALDNARKIYEEHHDPFSAAKVIEAKSYVDATKDDVKNATANFIKARQERKDAEREQQERQREKQQEQQRIDQERDEQNKRARELEDQQRRKAQAQEQKSVGGGDGIGSRNISGKGYAGPDVNHNSDTKVASK